MPWLLNVLYLLVLFVASPWLLYRGIKTGRYHHGWSQKLLGIVPGDVADRLGATPVIWLHGVSVGEVQLLKPVLERLRQRNPSATFVLSTTTQTGMELAKKILPNELLIYFPFDFTWSVKRVLRTIKPRLLVLGELELWPNLIASSTSMGVPIAVVNGRLSERSFKGYRKYKRLTSSMFSKLRLVAAQDATYAERFVACGVAASRVQVTGSTKFDNVTFDRRSEPVEQLRNLVGLEEHHVVWIVGSTQAPEELVAARAFMKLREEWPHLRLIVVPRHQERFASVYRELQEMGTGPVRRSLIGGATSAGSGGAIFASDWRVLLVDTIGELRWWWGLADVAIVGGSFGDRGGQNMLEPAAYGTNLAFGPNTQNFRDISELLLLEGAATRLQGLDDILPWIREQLANAEPGRERGARAQRVVRRHQGALERTVDALQAILDCLEPDLVRVVVQCENEKA